MTRSFRVCSIVLLLILSARLSLAQSPNGSLSLNESLSKLSQSAAINYLQPGFDPFGISMNGGWLGKAPKPVMMNFDLEFGIVAMGTFTKSTPSSFDMSSTYRFSKEQAGVIADQAGITANTDITLRNEVIDAVTAKDFPVVLYGPTITGSKDRNVKIVFSPNGTENLQINDPRFPFPVSVNIPSKTVVLDGVTGIMDGYPLFPSAAPQLKIGTLFGTQAILRFVPSIKISNDLGNFSFTGFGIQHNPNVWLGYDLPVDISLGFLIQKVKVGDIVEIKAASYGINVSKTIGVGLFSVTPYVGALLESSSINVNYNQIVEAVTGPENVNINFSLDGANKSRLTAGARFHIAVVDLTVDYNIGKMNSVTSGLFFSI